MRERNLRRFMVAALAAATFSVGLEPGTNGVEISGNGKESKNSVIVEPSITNPSNGGDVFVTT